MKLGANVAVFDKDLRKVEKINNSKIRVESDLERALPKYRCLVDATPEAAFISLENLHPEVMIAAPGVPLGLTAEAYKNHKNRVIHDPLQIGVATMLALAVSL